VIGRCCYLPGRCTSPTDWRSRCSAAASPASLSSHHLSVHSRHPFFNCHSALAQVESRRQARREKKRIFFGPRDVWGPRRRSKNIKYTRMRHFEKQNLKFFFPNGPLKVKVCLFPYTLKVVLTTLTLSCEV